MQGTSKISDSNQWVHKYMYHTDRLYYGVLSLLQTYRDSDSQSINQLMVSPSGNQLVS